MYTIKHECVSYSASYVDMLMVSIDARLSRAEAITDKLDKLHQDSVILTTLINNLVDKSNQQRYL